MSRDLFDRLDPLPARPANAPQPHFAQPDDPRLHVCSYCGAPARFGFDCFHQGASERWACGDHREIVKGMVA